MDISTLCTILFIVGAFLGLLATVKDGYMVASGRKAYRPWLAPDDPLNRQIGKSTLSTGLGFLFGITCVFFLNVWGKIVLIGSIIGFLVALGSAFMTWRTQREIEKLNTAEGQESYEQEQ